MSASIHFDTATQLVELHVRGTLKRSEFASCGQELAARIDAAVAQTLAGFFR